MIGKIVITDCVVCRSCIVIALRNITTRTVGNFMVPTVRRWLLVGGGDEERRGDREKGDQTGYGEHCNIGFSYVCCEKNEWRVGKG